MIVTSRFANRTLRDGSYLAVPISLWLPRWRPPYVLAPAIRELAPRRDYVRAERGEYERRYIGQLEDHGVERIRGLLEARRTDERPMALLCYEDLRNAELWCHRRMFAEWWLRRTGEQIAELDEGQSATF